MFTWIGKANLCGRILCYCLYAINCIEAGLQIDAISHNIIALKRGMVRIRCRVVSFFAQLWYFFTK